MLWERHGIFSGLHEAGAEAEAAQIPTWRHRPPPLQSWARRLRQKDPEALRSAERESFHKRRTRALSRSALYVGGRAKWICERPERTGARTVLGVPKYGFFFSAHKLQFPASPAAEWVLVTM